MEDVLYWLKMRFQMDAPEGCVRACGCVCLPPFRMRGCVDAVDACGLPGTLLACGVACMCKSASRTRLTKLWLVPISSYLQSFPFPNRYNPKVRPMMLTLEKIQYRHRPLAYYAMLTGLQVRCWLFSPLQRGPLDHLIHRPRSHSSGGGPRRADAPGVQAPRDQRHRLLVPLLPAQSPGQGSVLRF